MRLRSIHIEPAENGYTLEKRYSAETRKEEMVPYEAKEEKTVHESVDSLLKAVQHCLKGKQTKKVKSHDYGQAIVAKASRNY